MFVAFSPFDNFSLVILDFRSNSSMLKFVRGRIFICFVQSNSLNVNDNRRFDFQTDLNRQIYGAGFYFSAN